MKTAHLNKWLSSAVSTYEKAYGKTPCPVIYEVGSRDGDDGVELATRILDESVLPEDMWGMARVVLFDCNPPQIAAIREKYPDAILITDAISDKKGTAEFVQLHGDKNVVGSSSMDKGRVNLPWGKDNSIITVQTRRLDDIIEELGHQNTEIDIMKIDIEGYTFEALEGLGKYLRNVKVFHLETEIAEIARNKTNLEIFEFMERNGYRCTALENEWGYTIQDQVWIRD